MAADFEAAFAVLKPVLGKYAKRLSVKTDTRIEYTVVTKSASPFPQHKGQPMYFGSVRLGKAYVSALYEPGPYEGYLARAQEANAGQDLLQLQEGTGAGRDR